VLTGSLEHLVSVLRQENLRLRNLLRITHGAEAPPAQPTLATENPGLVTSASSPDAKLAIYARLFASRVDVYARYWENVRKGTRGWSPVTRSAYRKGVSVLQRDPLPLTSEVLEAHLRGDVFIGLYPLLRDATCWWLAADFDGTHAMLDAHAYAKAATSLGVPTALEISQSGRGAHVWTFFTEPVAASIARDMGTACIHRAMALRGSMSLSSYDRLFPNQNTVPDGGVGNLIAAPLNGLRRRERGTTLFLDLATWEPQPDQWEYLSRLDRMTPREVAAASKATRITIGTDVTRLIKSPATKIHPSLPAQIRATLGAQLTIRDEDLTPELSAALRHAATIHNPAFHEAQRARRSTWNLPRFIQGFDITISGDLVLLRGMRHQASDLLVRAGSRLRTDDVRAQGAELDLAFGGTLSDIQSAAVNAMLIEEDGVLHAPTGSGKTVMACAVIAERSVSTLILVDKKVLADQWRDQIKDLLGFKAGQFGGGRTRTTGLIDLAMLPTLARRSEQEILELTSDYGQVIVDECHHVAASSYAHTVSRIGATWWLGLTATPPRRDGLEQITSWQVGPIRHVMQDTQPRQANLLSPHDTQQRKLFVHETAFDVTADFDIGRPGAISELGGLLAADDIRNAQIVADVCGAAREGRKCLVLTRRRDHLGALAKLMMDVELDPLVMKGGTTKKELTGIRDKIANVMPEDHLLILTTIPYAGEGFDAPVLDTVFLAAPVSFPGILVQSVGRALRSHPDKSSVIVHDYVDLAVPMLASQFNKRRPAYRQMGFVSDK
jgi:superfamily II DNA or RNA helicase